MTTIPHILEPGKQPQHESDSMVTSGLMKSRFRSLFQWNRLGQVTDRPITRDGRESVAAQNGPRPSINIRSVSEATGSKSLRLHSSDGPKSRKREKILTDPPPLPQAYRQALVHATLDTPTSFTEVIRSRRNSLSNKESPRRDALEDVVQVKCAHKKTDSGDETCVTKSKIFMLVHGPYLLQFPEDAEANTLPEKILILDKDCVAFACDAVPGRPWVLQVSKTNALMPTAQERTLRPSWSRLTLRQPEDKRTVNTMLIIFSDSEELYSWLFAIRKEIEHLGGIEYRPDTSHDDQAWRENLTRRFGSSNEVAAPQQTSLERRRIDHNSSTKDDAKAVEHGPTIHRPQSQESSTSSKNTQTSLERLRDSLNSNGYSSNLARVSATDSASSTSPTTDCFVNIKNIADVTKSDLSLRTFPKVAGPPSGRSKSQPPRSSILERRKLSVNSLTLAQPENANAWKGLGGLPSTISGSPNDDLPLTGNLLGFSTIGATETIVPLDDGQSVGKSAGINLDTENQQDSNAQIVVRNPSQNETTGTKPKYSLFPVKSGSESKDEPLASPNSLIQTTSPPKSQPGTRSSSRATSRLSQEAKSFSKHRKSRSRTVTLELRQHRKSALLGVGQFEMPLRSPAVTDDMIMSNFGVRTKAIPSSPLPKSKVPGLADLTFDLDFLRMPYEQQAKRSTAGNHRTSSTRSVSSVYSDGSAAFSKAPQGPPPVGPLPAVPPQRNSQASRISQYSQHSNASRYSSRRSTRNSKPDHGIRNNLSRSELCIDKSTNDETPTPHKHSRTLSSTLNGVEPTEPLPPPPYTRKKSVDNSQGRSRSRGRQKSTGQQI